MRRPTALPQLFALLCALLAASLTRPAQAQEVTVLNEYKTQPEAWSFTGPEEAGVDAQGDLGLAVPVMTVPGRGMDFPVTFSYRSSIQAGQRASWVGMGWGFNPGTISREPAGAVLRSEVEGSDHDYYYDYGVDAFECADDGTGADAAVLCPTDAQPDAYFLTLPGRGTAELVQVTNDDFNVSLLPRYERGDFLATEQEAWRIEATPSAAPLTIDGRTTGYQDEDSVYVLKERRDIARFVVTVEDGTRYVFDAPTLKFFDTLKFKSGPRVDNGVVPAAGQRREIYVNTWRLVAILGADFTEAIPAGLPAAWPADGAAGTWVRFEYGDVQTGSEGADFRDDFTQVRYLEAIATPTHRATFEADPTTWDFEAVGYETGLHRRLERVQLQSRLGAGETVAEVALDHTSQASRSLFLEGLRFEGRGGAKRPGYDFAYDAMQCPNDGGDGTDFRDDLGYCTQVGGTGVYDTEGGSAFSLRSIRYPTGGRETFRYERDSIRYFGGHTYEWVNAKGVWVNRDAQAPSKMYESGLGGRLDEPHRQGGVRVRERWRSDGMGGDSVLTRYAYGDGRLSGIPPLYWQRLTQPGQGPFFDEVTVFAPSNRGQVGVYYDHVRETRDDESAVTTHYSTAPSPLTTVFTKEWGPLEPQGPSGEVCGSGGGSRKCGTVAVIQGNGYGRWGRPEKMVYENAGGGRGARGRAEALFRRRYDGRPASGLGLGRPRLGFARHAASHPRPARPLPGAGREDDGLLLRGRRRATDHERGGLPLRPPDQLPRQRHRTGLGAGAEAEDDLRLRGVRGDGGAEHAEPGGPRRRLRRRGRRGRRLDGHDVG